jgi:diguanylate cyclase (GGDEF)-like protein/PAS domain S-box-containing protein
MDLDEKPATAAASQRLQLSFEQAPVGILHLGLDGIILRANSRMCRLLDCVEDDLTGRHYSARLLAEDVPAMQAGTAYARSHPGQAHKCQVQLIRRDGTPYRVHITSYCLTEQGVPACHIWWVNDIGQQRLAFDSTHDKLTGLPARSLFLDRLRQAVLHRQRHGDTIALLCIGIDNYHFVNESLGHAAGDSLLAGIAQRLRGCVREHDTVATLGGNEFVVILEDVQGVADPVPVCETIFASLASPLQLDGQQVHASASIGIALCPQDGKDSATLLRYADMALTRAREHGGGNYQFFASEMNRRTLERIGMEAALRLAVFRDELQLEYQPLADLQHGQVASLEALVRWQHPVQGLIPAQRFVPVAEEAGLIGAIGAWVLRRTCQDLRAWRAEGLPAMRVAINLSPKQFRDRQLCAQIAAALAEHELEPSMLALEITETVLLQDAAIGEVLAQLKALGVALVLDDFGSGYSSLSNLKRFPFDYVKIDCDHIRAIVTDSGDAALAKTIISMAHHLGMQVVAEGVETEGQCDFLRRNMCDLIQGYFFAPPLPPEQIAALLREARALPPHLLRLQQQPRSLLLVDDEPNIVSSLKRLLRSDGYQIYSAGSGPEGLAMLSMHAVDVIVSDQRMPGMMGVDFLRKAKELYPDTIRIMLSGYTELQSVTDAVNEGAIYKFLTKPWEDELLRGHIADAFRLKEIADDNARLHLEVRTAYHELASANRRMEEAMRQQQQDQGGLASLGILRDLLQHLPLPAIGVDEQGLIAFVNTAAAHLFECGGALLGAAASVALPELFQPGRQAGAGGTHEASIDGARFAVTHHPLGAGPAARGGLIALSRCEAQP